MEEGRVPPTENHEPPLWLSPLHLPPGHETYIIQIPKDQIYRVPPPENGLYVQHYGQPTNQKNTCWFSKRFCYIGVAVVAFIVVLCITLAALHFALKPKQPTFSVANLVVKNVTKSSGRKSNYSQLQYQVTLTAKNPNAKMGINYEKDGQASLAYKDKNVADGDFPTLYQEQDMSKKVKISLVGSNKALPGEMDKSMNHKNSNIPISLDLTMKVPVSMKFGVMSWGMEVEVECVIKLNTLKAGAKVLSQECT